MDLFFLIGLLLTNSCKMGFAIEANSSFAGDNLEEFFQEDAKNSNSTSQNEASEETNLDSELVRRDVPLPWEPSDDYIDNYNVPWNYDVYVPQVVIGNRNDYFDDSSLIDSTDKQVSTWAPLINNYKTFGFPPEPQQYYQKNYYYNYNPRFIPPNFEFLKWENEPDTYSDRANRKFKPSYNLKNPEKNSCKQYLEFLKYAFQKLDEPEYQNDYANEYSGNNNEWRNRLSMIKQDSFTNQMVGPTIYVDNSAKILPLYTDKFTPITVDTSTGSADVKPTTPLSEVRRTTFPSPSPRTSYVPQSTTTTTEQPTTLLKTTTSSTIPPDEPQITTTVPLTVPHFTTLQPVWPRTVVSTNTAPSVTVKEFVGEKNFSSNLNEKNITREKFNQVEESEFRSTLHIDHNTYFRNYKTYQPSEEKTTSYPTTVSTPPAESDKRLRSAVETTENFPTNNFISSKTTVNLGVPYKGYVFATTLPPPERYPTQSEDFKMSDCTDKVLPCPETYNITYPLNGYCNVYVSCESGRAIRRVCREGLNFNIITKNCDVPHNSYCNYACPKPNGYFGVPGDCSGYFVCKNSFPEYRICPSRMHWDYKRNLCVYEELSPCSMKCTEVNEVKPYEGSCQAYIFCYNGIPFFHTCPQNKIFDGSAQACVPDHLSECENDPRLLTKNQNSKLLCKNVE